MVTIIEGLKVFNFYTKYLAPSLRPKILKQLWSKKRRYAFESNEFLKKIQILFDSDSVSPNIPKKDCFIFEVLNF